MFSPKGLPSGTGLGGAAKDKKLRLNILGISWTSLTNNSKEPKCTKFAKFVCGIDSYIVGKDEKISFYLYMCISTQSYMSYSSLLDT